MNLNKSERINSLDSLRGIASMVVVIFHCLISFPIFYYANFKGEYSNKFIEFLTISPFKSFWAGNEAVLLFFILSGFVLSLPFLNNSTPSYFGYIIKRYFRIYIPYIIIIFMSIILMSLFGKYTNIDSMSDSYNGRWNQPVTIKAILGYLIMFNLDKSNVNAVVWSLFHEMRISIFFPLLMVILIKYDWKKALAIALGLNIIILYMFGFLSNVSNNVISGLGFSFRETMYYTTFFILGASFAKYRNFILSMFYPLKYLQKFFIFVLSIFLINNRWINLIYNIDSVALRDLLAAFGILLLFSLVLSSKKIESMLSGKILLFLGKISYSLYLIHIPILMIVTQHLSSYIPLTTTFILVPFISVPVAYLSYKYIEVPSINLGKKVLYYLHGLNLNKTTLEAKYFQNKRA
ncbi:MAG: acyltransferase 3 [Bacillales bacterium]|jgi:peptidoglycan/LPS O-acetylase OafA/YrhL|nr:acyltransferase 3 [Bacillales bacterium]